jgi:hypothetical protein
MVHSSLGAIPFYRELIGFSVTGEAFAKRGLTLTPAMAFYLSDGSSKQQAAIMPEEEGWRG